MKIWGIGQISPAEKQDILSKHREIYDGYKTMLPNVSNTQPLYVQDFANDKNGLVVNNKGEVKQYTNVGINEQVEESKEVCDECGAMEMSEGEGMCSECGGLMAEGECMECGWKGEVGAMEEQFEDEGMDDFEDEEMDRFSDVDMDDVEIEKSDVDRVKKEFRPGVDFGKSFDKFKGMLEGTGKLSDIYNVEDLGDNDFDYVEGGGNDYGTFEKMHHMKNIKSEQEFEDPDNEDDGFEDIQAGEEEMYEQGYTGGGNAPDFDLSNIKPAYDFISDGPGDVYPTEGEMEEQCLDCDDEFETMESAWAEEEMDEANDVSGVQGIYGDMEPAYDFDSEGPGKAGPYQRSSWNEEYEGEDEDVYWEKDLADDELDLDLTKFNPEDKSWSEITAYTGEDEFSHMDEEVKESVVKQQHRIMEMFTRMKVIK